MNKTVAIPVRNHKYTNQYSGVIRETDFCTDYNGGVRMANRIVSDWCFDKQCRKDAQSTKRRLAFAK